MEDELLTVAEIAGVLKLNQQTVRNWIDAGLLPAIRLGRRVRVRRSVFERVLDEGLTLDHAPTVRAVDFWDGVVPDPVVPSGGGEEGR